MVKNVTTVRTTADPLRRTDIATIKMGQAALGMDDASYRTLLLVNTGKNSAALMNAFERRKVIARMALLGFKRPDAPRKAGDGLSIREPQVRKLRAMWYALAEAGAVDQPADAVACDKAIESWGKKQLAHDRGVGVMDALRFATGQQLDHLIEAMKAWGHRVKANIE